MTTGMNLLGFPVDGLDPKDFLLTMRVSFVILTVLGVVLLARGPDPRRAARVVLAVGLAGHTLAWCATMLPLPNVYGANGSQDRENHLGWANVVALGFSPLHTFQVDHLHFEPVWPLITAAVAGFEVDRVAAVFQWMPLVVGLALLLSVRFAWGRGMNGPGASLEGAFAALGAILLLASPQDFAAPFRNPWALTFLLKPNHALGLVLVPLAALALSRARDLKTRLFAGFVLHLIGWAFVIHMALFVAGLAVFVVLSWVTRRGERAKDLIDAGAAVGVNLLIVSPYLFMLVVAYPFLSGDGPRVSPFSERFLEGPLRMGGFFLLSVLGAWTTYRERGRLGRILASQWLAAHLIWQAFPLLGLFGQAREQDEAFYWCRFWTGLFAGVGMFQGAGLLTPASDERGRPMNVATRPRPRWRSRCSCPRSCLRGGIHRSWTSTSWPHAGPCPIGWPSPHGSSARTRPRTRCSPVTASMRGGLRPTEPAEFCLRNRSTCPGMAPAAWRSKARSWGRARAKN